MLARPRRFYIVHPTWNASPRSGACGLRAGVLLLSVCGVLIAAGCAVAAEPTATATTTTRPSTDARTDAPTVEHRHHSLDGPVAVDVVTFDLAQPGLRIETVVGPGVRGTHPVADLVAGMDKALGHPIAAVNGDYFEFRTEPRFHGTLQGTTIVRGELVSTPGFPTFWVDRESQPHLSTPRAGFRVTWPTGGEQAFAVNASTSDFRSEVRAAPIVLFTPTFGPSTFTTAGGRELTLEPAEDDQAWLPLKPNTTIRARVRSIHDQGDAPIPADGMVLSLARSALDQAPDLAVGDVLTLRTDAAPDLSTAYAAVAGAPLLLADGKLQPNLDDVHRHPRTAVGFAGQRVWFVVVDGRQPGRSIGMSHRELARFMLDLGATDAVNLDGGGSSTLWLRGRVINVPSAGQPRAVGNALVVTHRDAD